MKRILLLLLVLLVFGQVAARATDITVSSFATGPVYQQADTVAVLRLYYSDTFVDSNGVVIVGGAVGSSNFFRSITCTLNTSTKIATCPSSGTFTMPSTMDSSKPNVTLTGVLYGGKALATVAQRAVLFTGWKIPATLTSTTFTQLNAYNAARPASGKSPHCGAMTPVLQILSA